MTDQQPLFVKIATDAWHSYIKRTDELFSKLSDEQLHSEIAPSRNRGIYLLGHLTAVHDRMMPLMQLGERLYPQLDAPFLDEPDRTVAEIPPVKDLRQYWTDVNSRLNAALAKLTPDEWLGRHTSISEEDFKKEPHRNKLNVLLNRTNHLAYHYGQLQLLSKG